MQERIQNVYSQGLQIIESYQDNYDEIQDCQFDTDQQKIIFYSIYDVEQEIKASLIPQHSFKISQYYNNFALINAFNVLQSQIQYMKDIYEKRDNPFAVWLCDQGEWKIIIVNDKVPCVKNKDNLIESASNSNLQWPIIIEKAVLKLLGANYAKFNNQVNYSIQSFIYLLLGQPISKIQIDTIEELGNLLQQKHSIFYFELYYKEKYNAYVITQVTNDQVELQAINKESIFDEGIKQKDSKFLINWKTLQLQTILQVHLNQGYQTYTFKMQNPLERKLKFIEHTYIYTFKVNQNSEAPYWITVCQHMNSSPQQQQVIKYALIRLLIFKKNKKHYQLISESIDFTQNLYLNIKLEKGEYILLCQAEFYNFEQLSQEQQNQQQILKLQIQGISIPQKFNQNKQNEQFLKELFITIIRQQSTPENTYEYKEEGFPLVQRSLDKNNGFMYIYYENHGESNFEEFIKFTDNRNLIRYETQDTENRTNISIPPKEHLLLLYKFDPRCLIDSDAISFQYCVQFKNKQSEIIQAQVIIPGQSKIIPKQSKIIPGSQIIQQQQVIIPNQAATIHQAQSIINIQPSQRNLNPKQLFEYLYSQKNLQCKNVKIPEIFNYQHQKGVILLFFNKETHSLQVEISVKLKNLSIFLNDHIKVKDNKGIFKIQPSKYQFILLEIKDPKIGLYNYEMKVAVKYVQ